MTNRVYEYHQYLWRHMPGIYKIRRIHAQQRNCGKNGTAVTQKKLRNVKLQKCILAFFRRIHGQQTNCREYVTAVTLKKIKDVKL